MKAYHQQALELLEKGEWEEAHLIVQAHSDNISELLHALVHRFEGDLGNASYWYHRAGESLPDNTKQQEIERLRKLAEG